MRRQESLFITRWCEFSRPTMPSSYYRKKAFSISMQLIPPPFSADGRTKGQGMFDANEPKFTLPQGAVIIFRSGLSEPIRNLWDARVSQIAIYGRENGDPPFV